MLSIIHEFKNIKKLYIFLNKVYHFEKIMLNTESIIKAYERQIFSKCKNDSFVTQKIIEIFELLANSYLISRVVKNNLENEFTEYLNDILLVKEYVNKDIGSIFGDDEYIYLPKIKIEDIIYCFSYGENNYIMPGKLNQTNFLIFK